MAIACRIDPTRVGRHGPFTMAALSGRFVGCWAAFLAALAAYPALRNRPETILPAVTLTLWPIAALVAGIRNSDDLATGTRRSVYFAALAVLAVTGASLVVATQEGAAQSSEV